MNPIHYTLKFALALCIALMLPVLALLTQPEQAQPAAVQSGGDMTLQPPAFLKSAQAAGLAQVDFDFLLEEAGVTTYTKLDQELDLVGLELRFKTIRQQTEQFISGIVIAPGYEKLPEFGESAEVQVLLHRDGWIISYLTRYQNTSALFDWVNYDKKRLKDSTLIENVVRMLALDMGVSDFNVSYYDFRNPEATNLMLAAERVYVEHPGDSFDIIVPRGLTLYESSWSLARFSRSYDSSCVLNDEQLGSLNPPNSKWGLVTGELTKTKFPQDKSHKLSVGINPRDAEPATRSYCGIAIVYQEAVK